MGERCSRERWSEGGGVGVWGGVYRGREIWSRGMGWSKVGTYQQRWAVLVDRGCQYMQ